MMLLSEVVKCKQEGLSFQESDVFVSEWLECIHDKVFIPAV